MIEVVFVAAMAAAIGCFLWWSFRHLPGEEWQFLASVPHTKTGNGCWEGLNLTWYGALGATAYAVAVGTWLVLMGSIHVPRVAIIAFPLALSAICIPASKLVAMAVERRRYGFTVAGAFFVGVLLGPFVVQTLNIAGGHWGIQIPVLAAIAAAAVAYTLGEGLGRTACISFGCCYGKRIQDCHPVIRRLFANLAFRFKGPTKKANYEGGYEGTDRVPIQAVTAVLLTATALTGFVLFLTGRYGTATLACVTVSQTWRVVSEFLRADYRGEGKISGYQLMAPMAIACCAAWVAALGSAADMHAVLLDGLATLWDPLAILMLQFLWLVVFLHMGRSKTTRSTLSLDVWEGRL